MEERYNPMKSAEIAAEHNYNMIDGVLNNQLPALPPEREKKLDKVKEPPNKRLLSNLYVQTPVHV